MKRCIADHGHDSILLLKQYSRRSDVGKMASKIPIKVNRTPHQPNDAKNLCTERNVVLYEGGSSLASEGETGDRPPGKQIMNKESIGTSDTSSVRTVNMSHQAQLPEIQHKKYVDLENFKKQNRENGAGYIKRSRIPSAIRDHGGKYISSLRRKMTNEAQKNTAVRRYPDDTHNSKSEESPMSTGSLEAKTSKTSSEPITVDEKVDKHAIISNENDMVSDSNDMKDKIEQINASSKIPVLRVRSLDGTDDTHSTPRSHRIGKSHLLSPTKNNISTTATNFDQTFVDNKTEISNSNNV